MITGWITFGNLVNTFFFFNASVSSEKQELQDQYYRATVGVPGRSSMYGPFTEAPGTVTAWCSGN